MSPFMNIASLCQLSIFVLKPSALIERDISSTGSCVSVIPAVCKYHPFIYLQFVVSFILADLHNREYTRKRQF